MPLNKKRLQSLAQLLPTATQQPNTNWQIIRQINGKDKASAEGMLHGFVINYRSPETSISKKNEIAIIKSVTPTVIDVSAEVPQQQKVNNWSAIHNGLPKPPMVIYNRPLKKIGTNKPLLQKLITLKDTIVGFTYKQAKDNGFMSDFGKQLFKDKDSIYFLLSPPLVSNTKIVPPIFKPLIDSSVINPLQRNRFSNMLIVADVTGSMSPYIAQVFAWINNEAEKSNVKYVVCFNDGDGIDNNDKQIGKTGGIYGEPYVNAIQLSKQIISTMEKCQYNDITENDCEAIIKSIALCNTCDDVVLLADSWAPVRDINLIANIKKPVKIIACGNRYGIRPEYVEIALKTNGSLHFIYDDVIDLSPLKTGKPLLINGKYYVLKNDRVLEVVR